ncbi:MAG: PTS system mannose/fructose/N-acetylgalactosamine-transporter subunit IIB [Mycoplasmatales bacterium]
MIVKHIRLDSRLIHGQVASFWSNFLAVNRIIVVSNDVIKNKTLIEMLKMACPTGIKLSILSPTSLKKKFDEERYQNEIILIVTDTVETLHQLMILTDMTMYIKKINIGNLSSGLNKIQLKKSVYVNKKEYDLFIELSKLAVEIDAKMVPNDESIDFMELLKAKCKEHIWN